MKIERNSVCVCGSGRKAKRCHPEFVGMHDQIAKWSYEVDMEIQNYNGYQTPMPEQGWKDWKQLGCPHGVCPHDTEGPGCAAPDCGV